MASVTRFIFKLLLCVLLLSISSVTANELVVDGNVIAFEARDVDGKDVAIFQMESNSYRNTYLLDCENRRFLWINNVDLRTGEETGNNEDAQWNDMNQNSRVANAVYQAVCSVQSHQASVASKGRERLDQLPLRQGMRYSEAREIVLDAGWQARKKHWQNVPQFGIVKELYYDNGWQEIDDCAGTGTMPCRFEFLDIHNRLLVIITEGECLDNDSTALCDLSISRWYLKEQTAQNDHRRESDQTPLATTWKSNQSVALIHLPKQQARVGVIFPSEHQCNAAVFYVAGLPGLTAIDLSVDQQSLGQMTLGEFTLEDGTPISGAGISGTGIQALRGGNQLLIRSTQGELNVSLAGSQQAFRQAHAFCQTELADTIQEVNPVGEFVACDNGKSMPLTVPAFERFSQQVMRVAEKSGMGGANNPALEVHNFREAMQMMGYSLTETIKAHCSTNPMAMMTNPNAFAVGSNLIRAYDRLSEKQRATVYCPEEIAAIEEYKNGPNSWFLTGETP